MFILSRPVTSERTLPDTMSTRIFGLVAQPGEAVAALALRTSSLLEVAAQEVESRRVDHLLMVPAAGRTESAALTQLALRHCQVQLVSAGVVPGGESALNLPHGDVPALDLPVSRRELLAYWRECTAIAHGVLLQKVSGPEVFPEPAGAPADLSQADLASDPLARRFVTRPVRVQVEFAAQPGRLSTLEGAVQYRAGAALLTGSRGERWPVERRVFDARYRSDGPTAAGSMGPYRKACVSVFARQLMQPFWTRGGAERDILTGRPWDWLVQYAPGEHGIVAEVLFCDLYEPRTAG